MTPLDYLCILFVFCGWVPLSMFMCWRMLRFFEWIGWIGDDDE